MAVNSELDNLLLFLFIQRIDYSVLYLGKVPCNPLTPQGSSLLPFQPAVEGCCLTSIDVDFG